MLPGGHLIISCDRAGRESRFSGGEGLLSHLIYFVEKCSMNLGVVACSSCGGDWIAESQANTEADNLVFNLCFLIMASFSNKGDLWELVVGSICSNSQKTVVPIFLCLLSPFWPFFFFFFPNFFVYSM